MKTIERTHANKFAGVLTKLDYSTFKIDTDRKDVDTVLLCEIGAMSHGEAIGCYLFEYPKNPVDDSLFMRVFSTTISHNDINFKLGKTMRMIQPLELLELINVSTDLLLAEKLPNFLSDSFKEEGNE